MRKDRGLYFQRAMIGKKANPGEVSSSVIKEAEVCEYEPMTGTGEHLTRQILFSSKESVVQMRYFTVNIQSKKNRKQCRKQHVVRGEINSSVLSALRSIYDISNMMAEEKKNNRVPYLIGKTGLEGCINLGMPLKYLPEDSEIEMIFYKINNDETIDLHHRDGAVEEEWILFYICPVAYRSNTKASQSHCIVKCTDLEKQCYMCVFAPEGETIKDALCKDGRFLPLLIEEEWELVEGKKSWANNLTVNKNLENKRFEVGLKSHQRGTKSTGGPHKEQNVLTSPEVKTVSLRMFNVPNREPGVMTKSQARNELAPLVSQKKDLRELPSALEQQYPCFREQCNIINSSFGKSRAKKKQEEKFMIARKTEFDKVTKNSSLIKTQKILVDLSKSVGYIFWGTTRKEGCATCFVLCDRYILTCHHVVNMIVGEGIDENQWANKISKTAHVIFSYEDKHPNESDSISLEPWLGITNGQLDFAVLKLKKSKMIPGGLVHLSSPPPFNGLIYIIGHPDGEAKSLDGCSVVSIIKREQECSWRLLQGGEHTNSNCGISCIHMYTPRSFSDLVNNPNKVSYDTTFFHGSSGSPVFDPSGKLVALHTAGYEYGSGENKRSIIEFGFSMSSILSEIEKTDKAWYDSEIFPFIKAEATSLSEVKMEECTDVEMEECC